MEEIFEEKIYYKKYPYKVVINVNRFYNRMALNKYISWIENYIRDYNQDTDFYVVSEQKSSYFFENEQIALDFCSEFRNECVSFHKPRNLEIKEYLLSNPDIVLRKSYYHNKYPYSVKFKVLSKNEYDEINEFLNDYFIDNPDDWKLTKINFFQTSPNLYLLDKNDIVSVKLAFGRKISSVKEIKIVER